MPAPHACLPPPRRRSSAPLVLAMLLALAQGSWEARRGAAGSQRAGGVFIDKQQGWGWGWGWGEQARERVYARHDNTTTATRCWGQVASFLGKLGEVARKGVGGVRGDGDGREEEGKRSEAQKKREHMLQLLFEFTKRPQETGSPLRSVGRCLLCMRTVIVDRVNKGARLSTGRALKWTACIKVRGHDVARGTILVARRAWAHAR